MNAVQFEALARQILPIVGTLLTVLGIKSATANAIVDMLMAIAGPAMTIASVIWMFFANRSAALITKTATLPEVKSVTLEPTASAATVAATPSNVNK